MAIKDVPKRAYWTERDGKTRVSATVLDEVRIVEPNEHGDFCRVLQSIQKDGDSESFIRIGYYVKDHNAPDEKYKWGSQTTVMISRDALEELIKKAKHKGIL